MVGEGEVKIIDNCRFWDNSGVIIVGGGVDLVIAGEGVGVSKFGTWENFPDNIKVL